MARRPLDADEEGQMMVLAAVLLVIGLIALAGMVARVNQLGSQTAIESNQAILGELAPLSDAIDAHVANLQSSETVTATLVIGVAYIDDDDFDTAADVGLAITGPGIPAGTRITGFTDNVFPVPNRVTLSAAPTSSGSATLHMGTFALWASSSPTIQEGIVAILEQMQHMAASHGFIMDYEITCIGGAGGLTSNGKVIAHLSDGTVWAEVQTPATIVFQRTTCASVYG